MTRDDVTFTSGTDTCAGWFYAARGDARAAEGRAPCVVMAHGLAGVKEMRLDAYAERFAAAGFHVLVFDYRHFGGSGGRPRQLLDITSERADYEAAVAYARSRQEVDPERIVLWGTSLSGGHVLPVAHRTHPVAVISQVPHTDGLASALGTGAAQLTKLTGHAVLDAARGVLRQQPHYIPATGEPGSLALMTAPEAAEYPRLMPEGLSMDQRVAARFVLQIGLYSPGRALRTLAVPVLVQVGTRDQTTPPDAAVKWGRRGKQCTVSEHDVGHFAAYTGETFETFAAEQLAFLDRHVPTG